MFEMVKESEPFWCLLGVSCFILCYFVKSKVAGLFVFYTLMFCGILVAATSMQTLMIPLIILLLCVYATCVNLYSERSCKKDTFEMGERLLRESRERRAKEEAQKSGTSIVGREAEK